MLCLLVLPTQKINLKKAKKPQNRQTTPSKSAPAVFLPYVENTLWQEISKISKQQSSDILVWPYLLIILLMTALASILGFRHHNTFPALCSFLYPSLVIPSQMFNVLPPALCTVEASLGPCSLREEWAQPLFVGTALAQRSQHSGRAGIMATEGKRNPIPCIFSGILRSDEYS